MLFADFACFVNVAHNDAKCEEMRDERDGNVFVFYEEYCGAKRIRCGKRGCCCCWSRSFRSLSLCSRCFGGTRREPECRKRSRCSVRRRMEIVG
jgi:hypothetical protein